jgi:hypothetical protein
MDFDLFHRFNRRNETHCAGRSGVRHSIDDAFDTGGPLATDKADVLSENSTRLANWMRALEFAIWERAQTSALRHAIILM